MDSTQKTLTYESDINYLIQELRIKFLDCYESAPEDYAPLDVETVKTNNCFIKRFLTYNNLNENQAFDQLNEAMKWRKTFGIKRDYSDCAQELFQTGGMFIHGHDIEGRPVLYARVKTHMKVQEMERVIQDVIVLTFERLLNLSGDNGFTVVMDMSGAGLANVDMKILKFMITIMRKYYPDSLGCVLVVNLPVYMKTIMPVIRLLLGQKYSKMLHTVAGEELFKFIDKDNALKYLGGNSTFDFTKPPEECKFKAEELAHLYNLSPTLIRKSLKKYHVHMIEAKKLVPCSNEIINNH